MGNDLTKTLGKLADEITKLKLANEGKPHEHLCPKCGFVTLRRREDPNTSGWYVSSPTICINADLAPCDTYYCLTCGTRNWKKVPEDLYEMDKPERKSK